MRKTASSEWRRVVPVLDRIGLLTSLDAQILCDYCVVTARLEEASRSVSIEGMVVEEVRYSPKGDEYVVTKRNPNTVLEKEFRVSALRLISELGLSPTSRARIHVPGGDVSDDDDLLD